MESAESVLLPVHVRSAPAGRWWGLYVSQSRVSRAGPPVCQAQAGRELLRTRRQVVNHRSDVERQIKSKLLFYSIRSPFPSQQQWTGPYLGWLKGLRLEDRYLKACFDILLRLYEDLILTPDPFPRARRSLAEIKRKAIMVPSYSVGRKSL